MEILSNQVSELIKTGHFAAASQLLRGARSGRLTDADLYDTLHAELSFETGDDDAAMSLAQACLGRHPNRRTRLSTASAAMSVSFQPGRHGGRVAALGGGAAVLWSTRSALRHR